jgi:hypothetical protein
MIEEGGFGILHGAVAHYFEFWSCLQLLVPSLFWNLMLC